MELYELIEKYGKGKGEQVMWKATMLVSDFIKPMKESDKKGYWTLMRQVYGMMSDGHYNEEFALHDVAQIEYTDKEGKSKKGAYWTVEQTEEVGKTLTLPAGVNKWDVFVALNVMYSDLCKDMDEAGIIKATHLFFFADEDWSPKGSSTKIWDYVCCKYRK